MGVCSDSKPLHGHNGKIKTSGLRSPGRESPCLCGPLSSHISWKNPGSPLSRILNLCIIWGPYQEVTQVSHSGLCEVLCLRIQNHLDSLHSYLWDHNMIQEWKRHPTPRDVASKSSSWFLSNKNRGTCLPPTSELTLVSFNQFKVEDKKWVAAHENFSQKHLKIKKNKGKINFP